MGDWPGNAAAVKADWLDGVLRRSGVLSEATVARVEATPLGVGIGLMAEVSRLTIGYDRPQQATAQGAPASLIANVVHEGEPKNGQYKVHVLHKGLEAVTFNHYAFGDSSMEFSLKSIKQHLTKKKV